MSGDLITMDETSIKAGRKIKGKMHTGYFWPVYGDKDEICYPYAPTKSMSVISDVLGDFSGRLLSDGNESYASYVETVNRQHEHLIHAQCWVHTRRGFDKALQAEKSSGFHWTDVSFRKGNP